MNITVYLASSSGNDPIFEEEAEKLGAWIGDHGHTLIYGGSNRGLMGALARSVMAHGGKVIGVEPKVFVERGYLIDGLDELIITEDIRERRKKMIELGEAFIAFPGGTGTLEEISEVMTLVSLKMMDAPCVFYDLNGYYADLRRQLDKMIECGLSSKERQEGFSFVRNIEELETVLNR